jgi:hypothetical protein
MKILFYIFLVFYVIYVVNKFLTRFYFQKFNNSQQDVWQELMKKQRAEFEKQRKREGEIRVENLKADKTEAKGKSNGGEYVDYEIVK